MINRKEIFNKLLSGISTDEELVEYLYNDNEAIQFGAIKENLQKATI